MREESPELLDAVSSPMEARFFIAILFGVGTMLLRCYVCHNIVSPPVHAVFFLGAAGGCDTGKTFSTEISSGF